MGWGHFTHKLKKTAKKITGLSGHDLGMIALSPFTAGASLLGTSSAKAMLKNPGGTIEGAIGGYETGGPIGALLGAMSGGGGWDAMFGGGTSNNSASSAIAEQYRYNLALQQQNQKWQTAMSNTAHQREVQDLENAGLNPILSAGGSGASTGTPGGGSVGMPDKVAEKTAEMQNKIAKGTLMNEILNGIAQRKLAGTESAKNQAEIINQTNKTNAEVTKTLADAGYTQKQIQFYIDHGVFPGATIKANAGGSLKGPFGSGISIEGGGELPVGLHISPTTAKNIDKENKEFNKNHKTKKLPEGLTGLW